MSYDFVYEICVWGSNPVWRDRYYTVIRHIRFLSDYWLIKDKQTSVLFIISLRGTNKELEETIYKDIQYLPNNVETKVLVYENRGMLVGSLWDTWKYLEQNNISFGYIFAMEDDWCYNHWDERANIVDTEDIIYLGMFSSISFKEPQASPYRDWVRQGYKEAPNDEGYWVKPWTPTRKWTDGGLYFLKRNSLKEIENKIGCFHKAPKNKPFTYGDHGIDYGEMGFPTELHANGFNFRAFTEHSYETLNTEWVAPTQIGPEALTAGFLNDDTDWKIDLFPRKYPHGYKGENNEKG